MGLAGQILKETAARGSAAVLVAPGFRLGGTALAILARNMALHLTRRGLGRGALVAVRSDDMVVSLASILAAGRLGCRWTVAGAEAADLILDTAPDGVLLPGALRLDETWAQAPAASAGGMPPGLEPSVPWLILDGVGLTEADLEARFRKDAAVFDRPGVAVAGLGRPDEAEQLILLLSTLYHGGVVVESADPAVWLAEGVKLVSGRPGAVASCLAHMPAGARFQELRLWGRATAMDWPFDHVEQVTPAMVASGAAVEEAGSGTEAGLPPLDLLDRLLRDIEGVTDAITFLVPRDGRPDRLTVLMCLAPGADLPRITSEARVAALRLGGKAAVPERFLLADALPRHADGTADRKACRDGLLRTREVRRHVRAADKRG